MKKLWTLQKAADEVKISFTTFLRWEMGKQQPGLVSLEKLCQTFEKTPEELGYGHLTVSDSVPSQEPLNAERSADQPASAAATPIPVRSMDDIEQTHQRLIALAKELFPKECPPRINRFQDSQQTLHVFCDMQVDKSIIASVKTEFRRRTSWTLGVQRAPSLLP